MTIRAVIYCRLSHDKTGAGVTVAAQEESCRELADQLGWQVAGAYVDNDTSAYSRRKKRHGYERMLGELQDGVAGAVLALHADRLHRRLTELENYISICEPRGILTRTAWSGEIDLSTPSGRMIARMLGAAAQGEVEQLIVRTKIGIYNKRIALGLPAGNGRRCFGFEPGHLELREDEAAIIRESAERFLSGESIHGIVRWINGQGILTPDGTEWNTRTLKRILSRPAMAGYLVHQKKLAGKANHPPVLDESTWRAVTARLESNRAAAPNGGRLPRYLLSGIATCASCDGWLYIGITGARPGKPSIALYRCMNQQCPQRVYRSQHALDELVIGHVLERFAGRTVDLRPEPGPDRGTELSALESRREQVRDAFSDVTGEEPEFLRRQLEKLDGQIDAIRAEMASAAGNRTLDGLTGIDRDAWDLLALDRRRAVVRDLFAIRVLPAPRGPGFDPAYVDIRRKGS